MFFFALTAGILIGLAATRGRLMRPPRPHLSGELDLSIEQERRIQETWSGFMESRRRSGRRARFPEVDTSELEEFADLLPEEHRPVVDKIIEEVKNIENSRMFHHKALIDSVVEETKKILNEGQCRLYEELLEERGYPGPFPPHHPHPRGMGMRGRFHRGRGCPGSLPDSAGNTEKGEK